MPLADCARRTLRVEIGLQGRGEVILADPKLMSVAAIEGAFRGRRIMQQSDYERLPPGERPASEAPRPVPPSPARPAEADGALVVRVGAAGAPVGGAAVRVFDQSGDLPVFVTRSTFGGRADLGGVCSNGGASRRTKKFCSVSMSPTMRLSRSPLRSCSRRAGASGSSAA